MTWMLKTGQILGAASVVAALGACASSAPTAVDPSYLQGTALDRNAIGVSERTAFLEIPIHPEASELSLSDKAEISTFIGAYQRRGHGPLVMSLPVSSANPQLAVAAVAEARAIAYEHGVSYDEIAGGNHGGDSVASEPMILAYQTYDAVAPDCPSMAQEDFSDISSNNERGSLGCAVRTNLAAMIADPADLLGQRPIEEGDALRRATILEKFRKGESTGSTRSDAESGTVSQAVGD